MIKSKLSRVEITVVIISACVNFMCVTISAFTLYVRQVR